MAIRGLAHQRSPYLRQVPLPAITRIQGEGALFRAPDLMSILAVASERLLPADSKVWCLLWPELPDNSMMVTAEGQEAIEDSLATEIGRMSLPTENRVFTSSKWDSWGGNNLVSGLRKQFAWVAEPVALAPVRGKFTQVGVLGLSGAISSSEAKEVASLLTVAVANLARVQELHREAAVYQFLLGCHKESLLIASESGRIVAATETGTESLNRVEFGERRSPLKQPTQLIPTKILSAVLHGERPAAYGISISASPFRGESFDLAEPMVVIEFRPTENLAPDGAQLEPGKVLTPAQKKVYSLAVRGLDYKEMGQKLSISPHTVHRHMVEILRRLKCRDRVSMISRAIIRNSRSPGVDDSKIR